MTLDAGILLLAAIEQRLGIAERLANCIENPRAPERVRHGLAEMIRYQVLLIAAGYLYGNDCDAPKEVIGDPTYADAILDRLVHNAHRIDLAGDSLRCARPKSKG
jgi:hypothetical protein